jgi:Tfp pilus assembly protein PilO
MVLLIRIINLAALLYAIYLPYDMYQAQVTWEQTVYAAKVAEISEKSSLLAQKILDVKKADDFRLQRDAKIAALQQLRMAVDEQASLVPKKANLREVLKALADRADSTGLDFSSFKPSEVTRVKFLVKTPVNIELRGTYTQVMSFLDAAANMPRAVTTEVLNLTTTAAPRSGASAVNVKATLIAYHLDESVLAAGGDGSAGAAPNTTAPNAAAPNTAAPTGPLPSTPPGPGVNTPPPAQGGSN